MTLHFEGTPKTCAACRRALGLWCSDCVEAYGQAFAKDADAAARAQGKADGLDAISTFLEEYAGAIVHGLMHTHGYNGMMPHVGIALVAAIRALEVNTKESEIADALARRGGR